MPTAPPRLCTGCGNPVLGRCSTCQGAKHRRTDAQRGTSTERGYTAEWRVLRVAAFVRDHWTCVECGWKPEIVALYESLGIPELPAREAVLEELKVRKNAGLRHLHGDHIVSIERAPELRLCLENIQTLCNVDHARKSIRVDGWFGQ